jgi:beta-glucosidase
LGILVFNGQIRKPNLMKIPAILLSILVSTSLFAQKQPVLGARKAPTLKIKQFEFKDLNKNNRLDKYEDWRLSIEDRVEDLVAQMTLEEKLGFMLISTTRMAGDNVFAAGGTSKRREKAYYRRF